MDRPELLDQLVDLAQAAGIRVKVGRGAPASDGVELASGVCRVRGELWIVLSAAEGLEDRIAVVSGALSTHAREFLEGRYLPPAIRAAVATQDGSG